MITGETKSGYKFEIEEELFNDMELMDLLAETDQNAFYLGKVIEKLLGKAEKKKLYDSMRNEKGRVPIEEVQDALDTIFHSQPEGKK